MLRVITLVGNDASSGWILISQDFTRQKFTHSHRFIVINVVATKYVYNVGYNLDSDVDSGVGVNFSVSFRPLHSNPKRIRQTIPRFHSVCVVKGVVSTILAFSSFSWTRPSARFCRVMAAKLNLLIHKMAIQLHLVAESSSICSCRSRRPVVKLLGTTSYLCLM
jgi:hypothetical protein